LCSKETHGDVSVWQLSIVHLEIPGCPGYKLGMWMAAVLQQLQASERLALGLIAGMQVKGGWRG
jgi:hypothetical protein